MPYHEKTTNNGCPPPIDFTEGGGIKGIRNKVKNIGGFVSVFREPEFVVEIILPEEQ